VHVPAGNMRSLYLHNVFLQLCIAQSNSQLRFHIHIIKTQLIGVTQHPLLLVFSGSSSYQKCTFDLERRYQHKWISWFTELNHQPYMNVHKTSTWPEMAIMVVLCEGRASAPRKRASRHQLTGQQTRVRRLIFKATTNAAQCGKQGANRFED